MTGYHARDWTSAPSAARIYNYMLGGAANTDRDKVFARALLEQAPFLRDLAHQNRDFLLRGERFMMEQGVRQFLDIGSGIPASPNVHEVARDIDPDARVVYVDSDNIAVTNTARLVDGVAGVEVLAGDFCLPHSVLDHPTTTKLIDWAQPVGLLVVAVLHFIRDDRRPHDHLATYLDRLAPGSYVAISHATEDSAGKMRSVERLYDNSANPGQLRGRGEFVAFFNGLELVEPGVTYAGNWPSTTADPDDEALPCMLAAIGRKL